MGGGMGYVRVLQVGGEWWNSGTKEVLGPPTGPKRKSAGVRGCPLTPRPTQGGIGASHGPGNNSVGVVGCPMTPRTTHGGTGVSL